MAYTTIDDPTIYFNTKLYTGNSTTDTGITGVGFQPDWLWVKSRGAAESNFLNDSVRGAGKNLKSESSGAEGTQTQDIKSFDSDGFTLGSNDGVNDSGFNYVSWNWKAGTSFTNDASSTGIGTIDSTGSVNDTAGFSIISYTGTGSNGSIKHGLSTAPRMMIFKNRDEGAEGWFVYHESVGNTKRAGLLDETSVPSTSSTFFQDTSPTSSIITLGSNHGCNGPDAMICYAFAEKQGYSKFGSYTGNDNTDGTFVYTGFKPAWVMVKRTDATNYWFILDNKRTQSSGGNPIDQELYANASDAENNQLRFDFCANGFKNKAASAGSNGSGASYIYMAFAENPFVTSSGVPACAK